MSKLLTALTLSILFTTTAQANPSAKDVGQCAVFIAHASGNDAAGEDVLNKEVAKFDDVKAGRVFGFQVQKKIYDLTTKLAAEDISVEETYKLLEQAEASCDRLNVDTEYYINDFKSPENSNDVVINSIE